MRNMLSELGASLSRNTSMTISLVVTMTVSLLLAAFGLLLTEQADRTENFFGNELQLRVDLCTENSRSETCVGGAASDEQKQAVQQALRTNPEVERFETNTPEQNYQRARELLSQSETGRKQLETLSPEVFPESYAVTLKDPQVFDGVQSQVSGLDGVDSVTSLRDLLKPLFSILKNLRWAALATSLLLIIAAVLQVSNTIRMTAYARRREISIMRLVGASSWHIQLPFVLESLLAAVASAVLAAGGMAAFMGFVVYGYFRVNLGQITTWVGWGDAAQVMGYTTILAVVLALVPTLVMTRKYLDV